MYLKLNESEKIPKFLLKEVLGDAAVITLNTD